MGQTSPLKRIKTHRKWLLDPPKHKPSRSEFGLPETTIISKDIMGAIKNLEDKGRIEDHAGEFGPEIMSAYQKERSYYNAMQRWHQYENWKKTRNPARAKLEAAYGYDCKHAMHLVRLMRMCREILLEGKVIVKRPDREELLAIRNGAWSYDQLIEWAEKQDIELNETVIQSQLPKSPDRGYLDVLCQTIVEKSIGPL